VPLGSLKGILLCYGLVGPLAARMGKMADEEHAFMQVLRVTIIAFLKGVAPIMAVEMGRRMVPGHVRPSTAATIPSPGSESAIVINPDTGSLAS